MNVKILKMKLPHYKQISYNKDKEASMFYIDKHERRKHKSEKQI